MTGMRPALAASQVLQKIKFTGSGPNKSRQTAAHPHSTIIDPSGKYLLVPDLGSDLVRIFSIDATSGNLTACASGTAGAGDGPHHGTWWSPNIGSTDGQMLYTVNELSNSVSAWTVAYPSSECLTLTRTQTLSTYAAGITAPALSKAAEVHVSGNFLYAVNRNDKTFAVGGQTSSNVAIIARDPATGKLGDLVANLQIATPGTDGGEDRLSAVIWGE
ncbi:Lactonase, 7-bladed beta-propeller-domain-containing protein [Xylariales sp. AK1849]|nr:Lactonase, 7-bladed beta-propeller-domain-containing protein [Xylariales sp. AK1849]